MIGLPYIRPHVEKLPIFIKHLDAAVSSIRDIQATILVDRDRMYRVELAGAGARRSPSHEKLSVSVEFDDPRVGVARSEEHTSELQSHSDLVCRLLLEKKNS